jgi:hypothetical protein
MDGKQVDNGKVRVRAVHRDCQGCRLKARAREVGWICPMCASLVQDEDGRYWIYHKWLDGDGYQAVRAGDLEEVPRMLLIE